MARKSRATIMREYDEAYAMAIAEINSAMQSLPDSARTVQTAFGSATLTSIRWQPASIGGTWGQYRMENGNTRGFVVSANQEVRLAQLTGVELPKFPR